MAETSSINTLYKFDIISFAKSVISEIDSIRSYKKENDSNTGEGFQIPIESRINAFFRLIGLPMFVSLKSKDTSGKSDTTLNDGKRVLTPGFDSNFSGELTKFNITNSSPTKAINDRELNLAQIESSIGTEELNKRMTDSLYCSIPLQANIPATGTGLGKVTFGKFRSRSVFKKLKPLRTAYLVDRILPRRNELARPFVLDVRQQKIDDQTTVTKPFIETVARIRLITTESAGKGSDNRKTQDFLSQLKENFPSVSLPTDGLNVLEQFILDKLLSSVQQLAVKRYMLNQVQERILKENVFSISVKTSSSKRSVFGKRAAVTVSAEIQDNTTEGRAVQALRKKVQRDEALLSLLPSEDTVNISGTTPKKATTKSTTKNALVDSFISLLNSDLARNRKNLASVQAKVKKTTQKMEKLRVELEMMTGEFTGISIPDIVAVIIGLFLIDKSDLVGLFDDETIDNMSKDKSLASALQSLVPNDAESAVTALEGKVDEVFDLLQSEIEAVKNRSNRTSRIKREDRKKLKQPRVLPSYDEQCEKNTDATE